MIETTLKSHLEEVKRMLTNFDYDGPCQIGQSYSEWYEIANKQIWSTMPLYETISNEKGIEIYSNYWKYADPKKKNLFDKSEIQRLLNYAQLAIQQALDAVQRVRNVPSTSGGTTYFSDQESGPRQRVEEEIQASTWGGIVVILQSLIRNGSFGIAFPEDCPDGFGSIGTNEHSMFQALQAEISNLSWPLDESEIPSTFTILDLIQFCYLNVAKPIRGDYHSYFAHYHLDFDRKEGQVEFRQKINRIFARNGLAFELEKDGHIMRLAPPVLRETLQATVFSTGDSILDSMLEAARKKYLSPDLQVRREALEKLWDAWERLKTIEPAKDKKASVTLLLDKASSEENFRRVLEEEAKKLTDIGNNFLIRHSETNKTPLGLNEHIDYLFHRLFAIIRLLLETRKK